MIRFEMKTALLEYVMYGGSWVILSVSSLDGLEKLLYGLLTGIGIASGKWVVEEFKKWKDNGGCVKCTLKRLFKI